MSFPLAAIRINRVPRIEMLFCLKQLDQLKTWWPHRNHYGPTDTCRPNPSLHVFAQLEMAQSGSVHASSWCLVRTCQQPQYPNARMSSLFWGADSADSSSSIVKTSWHWVVQLHHHRTKPLSEPCKLRSCVLMKLLNLNLIDIWVCLKMGHQTSSGLGKSCSLLTYIKNNHYYIWDHLGSFGGILTSKNKIANTWQHFDVRVGVPVAKTHVALKAGWFWGPLVLRQPAENGWTGRQLAQP